MIFLAYLVRLITKILCYPHNEMKKRKIELTRLCTSSVEKDNVEKCIEIIREHRKVYFSDTRSSEVFVS